MLELNKGDFVIIESAMMRDAYRVAQIMAEPTAKNVMVSVFRRKSGTVAEFELESEINRRARNAVVTLVDGSVDPLRLVAEINRANELGLNKATTLASDQRLLAKSLASGDTVHADWLERRCYEIVQWQQTGLLPKGYLTSMAKDYPEIVYGPERQAERDTIAMALRQIARYYGAVEAFKAQLRKSLSDSLN